MGVRRLTGVKVSCDVCSRSYDWTEFATIAYAIEQVRADGWVVAKRGADVTCPECVADAETEAPRPFRAIKSIQEAGR